MTRKKATLIGLAAVILWSSMIGLIRNVSEGLGPVGGAAMLYTATSVLLLVIIGFPHIRTFSRRYLYTGSVLFVAYEVCLALSVGYANNGRQAIEVGMVNYLWPALTILFAVMFNGQKTSLLIAPGLLFSGLGVFWVLGGDSGLALFSIMENIRSNPFSYFLALAGAIIWAAYCTVTSRFAEGKNGITLFFILTAITLWITYFAGSHPPMHFDVSVVTYLLMASVATGLGYAAWNTGLLYGNVTLLAAASYFIPVLSAALSAFLLSTPLSFVFWQGALLVCVGSLLCWFSTRKYASKAQSL